MVYGDKRKSCLLLSSLKFYSLPAAPGLCQQEQFISRYKSLSCGYQHKYSYGRNCQTAEWRIQGCALEGEGNSLREMGRVSFSFIHFGGLSKVCQLVYQEIGLRFLLAASSRLKLINFLLHRLKEMSLGPPVCIFQISCCRNQILAYYSLIVNFTNNYCTVYINVFSFI